MRRRCRVGARCGRVWASGAEEQSCRQRAASIRLLHAAISAGGVRRLGLLLLHIMRAGEVHGQGLSIGCWVPSLPVVSLIQNVHECCKRACLRSENNQAAPSQAQVAPDPPPLSLALGPGILKPSI